MAVTKLRHISIRNKIYLGFFIVCSFIAIISSISYQLTKQFSLAFDEYQIISLQSDTISEIRNRVQALQTSMQVYISSGYESFALEISDDIRYLVELIDEAKPLFRDDVNALNKLDQLHELMHSDYNKTLVFASEELIQRNQYVDEFNALYDSLLLEQRFDPAILKKLTQTQSVLHQYLNSPDISIVNEAIEELDSLIKQHSSFDLNRLEEYKRLFTNSVQSNRGFLFLISVVMAGASAEFHYVVDKLDNQTKDQILPLRDKVKRDLSTAVTYLILIFIALILTVVIAGYFTAISISKPLEKIKNTFVSLSLDEVVDEIPGMLRNDEIGSLARAADIFRQKNESTKLLLQEIKTKNIELDNRNNDVMRLETETKIDGLTNLYNHKTFYSVLKDELVRSLRYERQLSLLMIDIDNFKQINDTYGHQTGDIVLYKIGKLLKNMVRSSDTVFRYGGEEVAVLQPETDIEHAAILAERIRKGIEESKFESVDGTVIPVTVSVGAANFPSHATDVNNLVKQADLGLYQAKMKGKNQVCIEKYGSCT